MENKQKILFVCTANRYRSRTSHELFENNPNLDVKSCGCIEFYVRDTKRFYWDKAQTISQELLEDADKIYVMEKFHLEHISNNFGDMFEHKITNLNIDDIYEHNDPELIEILKEKLNDLA